MKSLFLAVFAALATFAAPAAAQGPSPELVAEVDIPYEKFTLDNGLTVIVHEDRKAPVVAVSMWYHVGSKDEPPGRTGFAHLFEHLMFNGTEHYDKDFFIALQNMGATSYNGTTFFDRTNYYQTVPTPALERILFLESDRMGHLLGAVDQEKLDNQRGVVQNEKRERLNTPYGEAQELLLKGIFPLGHPYHHIPIGSMEDLDAAALDDVKEWFKTWYGPNNAVLVLAGDIDAATARPLVEKYFGAIPPGPPVDQRTEAWVPSRTATVRETMQDQVANARIYRYWAVPGLGREDTIPLSIAAAVLAGGDSSRLYRTLVRDEQVATSVSGYVLPLEAAGIFGIEIDVKPGVDPARVEQLLDRELTRFLAEGPTKDEVDRVAMRAVAGTIRGLESVGGNGGKAATLAEGELYMDDPRFFKEQLAAYVDAAPAEVEAAAKEWIAEGDYRLTVTPVGELSADAGTLDRSALPEVGELPPLDLPEFERATLSNGIPVTFARRATVPVVQMAIGFNAGDAADARDKLGTQALMLALLDEGTETRSAIEIAEETERLGAAIGASASFDTTEVSLSALKTNLPESLDLFADIVRNPAFATDELERVRDIQIAGIEQELTDPQSLALRVLPPLIYGEAHPYGVPLTGSGTIEGVEAVTREDLFAFHRKWMRPDNAQIFVVGATTLEEILPQLEAAFGDWRAAGPVKGTKLFQTVLPPAQSRIILMDRPGSPQSFIFAGYPLVTEGTDDNIALTVANVPLGGIFTSRLNTNLRETKGWSYGVGTSIPSAREQMPFYLSAPVQTDKTGAALAELMREIREYVGGKPVTEEEVQSTIAFLSGRLPGAYESAASVMEAMQRNALLDRPDDYQETYAARLKALTPQEVAAAAAAEIDPDKLLWVVVGDADKVRPQLQDLGLPVEER